jgi:hypothetical protein
MLGLDQTWRTRVAFEPAPQASSCALVTSFAELTIYAIRS